MKTEIENIIYNYADKVKAKYRKFSLGLLINHIHIYKRALPLSSKKGLPFCRKR